MKRSYKIGLITLAVVVLGGAFIITTYVLNNDQAVTPATTTTESQTSQSQPVAPVSKARSTEEQLLYLIEEEKLAHDVYTVMYQKYGTPIFGNIIESETTHENHVLVLLQARQIADPRSATIGVFTNQTLQNFYNQLIAQGNKSEIEAYRAGVTIEQTDITDIGTQLATTTDQDIIDTLGILRNGSENHLRAFNKQL